jgi:hypothetical protein
MLPKRILAALLLTASTLMLLEISPHVQVDDTGLHVALVGAAIGVGSTEGELTFAYHLLLAYSTVWGEGIPMASACKATLRQPPAKLSPLGVATLSFVFSSSALGG